MYILYTDYELQFSLYGESMKDFVVCVCLNINNLAVVSISIFFHELYRANTLFFPDSSPVIMLSK